MSDEDAVVIFGKIDQLVARLRTLETRVAFGAGVIVAVQVLGMIVLGALL